MTQHQNGGPDKDQEPAGMSQAKVSAFVREAAGAIATVYLATHSMPAAVATAAVAAVVALRSKVGK